MKNSPKKIGSLIGLTLSVLFFSAATSAGPPSGDEEVAIGCLENDDILTEVVTPYGGSSLVCPNDHTGCTIENIQDDEKCDLDGHGMIEIQVDNKIITWTLLNPEQGHNVDVVIHDTNIAANGCFHGFGADQTSAKAGAFRNNGNPLAVKTITFCQDGVHEVIAVPPPPLATVEQCVIQGGESKEVHGVTFSCPGVDTGETRTIIVTEDTTDCVLDHYDSDNNPVYICEPVPGFGFLDPDTGEIDFKNVCQCVGPLVVGDMITPVFPVLKTECDPDPANTEGGCEVGDSEVPVEMLFQNPRCVTSGGRRKCY